MEMEPEMKIRELEGWSLVFDGKYRTPPFQLWTYVHSLRVHYDPKAYLGPSEGWYIARTLRESSGAPPGRPCALTDHQGTLVWRTRGGDILGPGDLYEPYREMLGMKAGFGDGECSPCDFPELLGRLSGLLHRRFARRQLGLVLTAMLDKAQGHQVVSPRSPVLPDELLPLRSFEIREGRNGLVYKPPIGSYVIIDNRAPVTGWYVVVKTARNYRIARLVSGGARQA